MMTRSAIFLLLLATSIFPAWADDCPNAKTAKLGFILERQGARAEVRPASDHFVHVRNIYSGGKQQDVIYYRGFFPVSRFDDTARSINIPVSDIRSVFPLEAKDKRALTYASAEPDRVGALRSVEITVSGQERLELGACSYDVLVVRNRTLNADGRLVGEHTDLYSPELGFILAKRYDENGGRITTVKYQSIRPLGRVSPL
ncbi:hypothetical protein [Microvirga subterranea]|uniref:Uncharacterized protein n=1 Tax=Microvirga subterranea TaxID=186651 RepID=A0A370HGS9_9HYPH|nr:hypothetical protein [Microvirga subterranea]RDI57090.1 hypothetical protein DES45_1074 [Microvirga subterranea]